MRFSLWAILIVALSIACLPAEAQAGMPSITLTDLARMRVQTISFFLMGLLFSSWIVQRLWNYLRRDFSSLPRLSYAKALSAVILWGFLFVLVLTMISGARELMTPGAWEKQGLTYRLSSPQPELTPQQTEWEQQRRESLEQLRIALWEYARTRNGHFPTGVSDAGFAEDLWLSPAPSRPRYLYVGGSITERDGSPLVYEPSAFGDRRLVLLTDGTTREMDVETILASLPPEGR